MEEQGYSPLKDLIIENQENKLPESAKEEDPENKAEISDDEYSDDSYTGGAKPYSLHPNPFIDKIKKKRGEKHSGVAWFDKEKKDGNRGLREDKNQFSRQCQWNRRRIPVILNETEKLEIEEKVPGFFDENEIIQYSTNPLKQKIYFTCPRYWDLRSNLPVKPENVNKEDIIDDAAIKSKRVDLDKQHIIEFAENREYKKMIPGFFDNSKNKNGFFILLFYKSRQTI